jgi:uncharacterized protein
MERIVVPAAEGRAARVEAGRRFRIVDLEGSQVVDLFAFVAEDAAEYASAEHTRVQTERLFPWVGESFVTNERRPILTLIDDTSPGYHDMLCAACDPARYRALGAIGWHASCRQNLQEAMAALRYDRIEIPQPINLFMRTPPMPDGSIMFLPAETRPGDHVELQTLLDVVVVASSCPQDMNPINRGTPTPIAIDLV